MVVPRENEIDVQVPDYLRLPERGTRLAAAHMISRIDHKIKKLESLGLHPHQDLLSYRRELIDQLGSNGPYRLRTSSVTF